MKGDAIKVVAASALAGIEPTKAELGEALAETVDILIDGFADLKRIADAAERAYPDFLRDHVAF